MQFKHIPMGTDRAMDELESGAYEFVKAVIFMAGVVALAILATIGIWG